MKVANLATYPPRHASMLDVVRALAPQLDRLNVVLNEYEQVPQDLDAFSNVVGILPEHDTKDAGKFLPDVSDADYVFLVDDDLIYPDDYVARTIASFEALGPSGFVGAYHGSLYVRPPFELERAALTNGSVFTCARPRLRTIERYSHSTARLKTPSWSIRLPLALQFCAGRTCRRFPTWKTARNSSMSDWRGGGSRTG